MATRYLIAFAPNPGQYGNNNNSFKKPLTWNSLPKNRFSPLFAIMSFLVYFFLALSMARIYEFPFKLRAVLCVGRQKSRISVSGPIRR